MSNFIHLLKVLIYDIWHQNSFSAFLGSEKNGMYFLKCKLPQRHLYDFLRGCNVKVQQASSMEENLPFQLPKKKDKKKTKVSCNILLIMVVPYFTL